MLGSSIERQDRRRRRDRLNGGLRAKVEGEAGWDERLSCLLYSDEEFVTWVLDGWLCPALASLDSSGPPGWGGPDELGDELAWKSPSAIELERRRGAKLLSDALEESLPWHDFPQGANRNSNRLFSMHISAENKKCISKITHELRFWTTWSVVLT